jgi:dTMP kinase
MQKGVFVAFEGIDGSGKSTQIRELVKHIFEKDKHNHVILTRNPYKNTNIRAILREDDDPATNAEKLADLYINDRKKQVEEIILPNLANGHFVVTDRYKLSTIAYQSAQGLDMKDLIEKQSSLPVPDMCFIVDVSPEEAMRRMRKEDVSIRGKEHKFEAHADFIKQLRENYHKAKEILANENIFLINGERTPQEITAEIKDVFDQEMQKIQR